MYICEIENEYGEKLRLTQNKAFKVYQIDGLQPPTATINTSSVANFDGSRFNSSKTNERNIVIYLTIEGDCEANRIELYKYVKSKRYIKFYYKTSSRDVYAEGYVESVEIGFFEMKQTVQISILCPYPYFKSVKNDKINFSTSESLFHFPFAYEETGDAFSSIEYGKVENILNSGDIENGIVIEVMAVGRMLNPAIYNHSKNEYFKVNVDMFEGDLLTINTNKNQKKVTLTHDGITQNVINSMVIGSSWFQLLTGDNLFSYQADEFTENMNCILSHQNEYEGV